VLFFLKPRGVGDGFRRELKKVEWQTDPRGSLIEDAKGISKGMTMRLAATITGTAMLAVILLPKPAWEQSMLKVPSAVKLADLDKPTAAKWQAFPKFPVAKNFVLVPQPMGDDGLARLDFNVISDNGAAKGTASLLLLPSANAASFLRTIWQAMPSMDQDLVTTFTAAPANAGDSTICLTTSNRTSKENHIVCDVTRGPKLFDVTIVVPAPVSAAMIAETRDAAEAAAGFADALTTAPPIATAADNPDPATAAIVTPPLSNHDGQDSGAMTLVSLDPKRRAAFDRVKTWAFKWDYSDGDWSVTGAPVSVSPDYAEYTRRISGTRINPASTVEFEIYDDDLDAIISAQGWNTAWLPAGHGDALTFSTSTGGVGREGDIRCLSAPLPKIAKVVTRCFTNKNSAVAAVTLITEATSNGDTKSSVNLAGALATDAVKDFQQTMHDLSK
jgi:hypothetical protein